MNATNPWDVAPKLSNGDFGNRDLYTAVGYAISKWEELEYSCSILYASLLNSKNNGAVQGYGKVVSFKTRSDLLISAIDSFRFGHLPGFSAMKLCANKVVKFSARRNEIAHGVVTWTREGTSKLPTYYLVPASYATSKKPKGLYSLPAYSYVAAQVRAYGDHFSQLTEEINYWNEEVNESWLIKYEGWPRPTTRWHQT